MTSMIGIVILLTTLVSAAPPAILPPVPDVSFCRDGLEPALELAAPSGLRHLVPLRRIALQLDQMHSRLLLNGQLASHLTVAPLRLVFDDGATTPFAVRWDRVILVSSSAAREIAEHTMSGIVAADHSPIPPSLLLFFAQTLVRVKALEDARTPNAWSLLRSEERALRAWVVTEGLALPADHERATKHLVPRLQRLNQSEDWSGILNAVAPFHARWFDEAIAQAVANTPSMTRADVLGQWLSDVVTLAAFPQNRVATAEQLFEGYLKAVYLSMQGGVFDRLSPEHARTLFALWRAAIAEASPQQSPVTAP